MVPTSLRTHLGPHSTVWDTGSLWSLSRLHSTLLLRELIHLFNKNLLTPGMCRELHQACVGNCTRSRRYRGEQKGSLPSWGFYHLWDEQQVWLLRNQACSPPCSLLPSSPGFSPSHLSPGVWAFLMTQLVKNPPAIQEIQEAWVRSWVGTIPWGGHGNPFQYS